MSFESSLALMRDFVKQVILDSEETKEESRAAEKNPVKSPAIMEGKSLIETVASKSKTCSMCHKPFGRIFTRHHVCKTCLRAVCSSCSRKAPLRICNECFAKKSKTSTEVPDLLNDAAALEAYARAKKGSIFVKKAPLPSDGISFKFKRKYDGNFSPAKGVFKHSILKDLQIDPSLDIPLTSAAKTFDALLQTLKVIETEYVSSISILFHSFMNELIESRQGSDMDSTLNGVFKTFGNLLDLSLELYFCASRSDFTSLFDFLPLVFKIFTEFLALWPKGWDSRELIPKLLKKSQHKYVIEESLQIDDLFFLPVKHIQKYVPILSELSSFCGESPLRNGIHHALEQALKQIVKMHDVLELSVLESRFSDAGEKLSLVSTVSERRYICKADFRDSSTWILLSDQMIESWNFRVLRVIFLRDLQGLRQEGDLLNPTLFFQSTSSSSGEVQDFVLETAGIESRVTFITCLMDTISKTVP
jgi:hypothetical protein